MVYNARGKKEAALQEFEKAVRATPELTAAHYQLSLSTTSARGRDAPPPRRRSARGCELEAGGGGAESI